MLSALSSLALLLAALKMTDAEYFSLAYMTRAERMVMIAPFWYQIVNVLTHVWIWSEFITMLFNKSVVLFMISWRGR